MHPSVHIEAQAEDSRGLLAPLVFCAVSWAGLIGLVLLLL